MRNSRMITNHFKRDHQIVYSPTRHPQFSKDSPQSQPFDFKRSIFYESIFCVVTAYNQRHELRVGYLTPQKVVSMFLMFAQNAHQ